MRRTATADCRRGRNSAMMAPHSVAIAGPMQVPMTRSAVSADDRRRHDRARDRLVAAAFVVLFVAGFAGLAAATGWEETLAELAQLSLPELGFLLALSLVNYVARAARWHLLARRLGVPVTPGQSFRHFFGGFAMTVTPGRVGELVRMRWIRRETGWSLDRSAPLVLVDRAADLAAMALILAAALGLSSGAPAGAAAVVALALALAWGVTHPGLLRRVIEAAWRIVRRAPRLFARARRAARSLQRFQSGPLLVAAFALGIFGWLAEAWAFHLLLGWMGAGLGFWSAAAIFVFSTLAGGLTGAPGGVGGAEAAMFALLVAAGVDAGAALAATAVIRLTTLWFAIGIGIFAFPMAERHSKRGAHALENR